jgi:hypothetical protein
LYYDVEPFVSGRPWFLVLAAVLAAAPAHADETAPGITGPELRARARLTVAQRAAMRETCAQRLPACDRLALLGNLERTMVSRALEHRGLAIDRAPEGKVVHRLHVFTAPVFGEDEQIFTWANVFHVSSKEYVIEREILLRPGEAFSQDSIDETQRKLRDPLLTEWFYASVSPSHFRDRTIIILQSDDRFYHHFV